MSRFNSTRQALNAVDASRSSASSLDPALSTLSTEDAEILEAIVAKSPDATTFMTVFKAYSEVLQQRGLDPGNDVVYYKQLLKLGVVKGINWGTKWNIVKTQLGLDLSTTAPRPERRILPSQLSGLPPQEEDVFTLHSHADETETAVDHQHVVGHPSRRPNQPTALSMTDATESFDLHSEIPLHVPRPPNSRAARDPIILRNRIAPSFDGSEFLNEAPIRSSTPPLPRHRRDLSHSPIPELRGVKGKGREQPASNINEAQAWKKVEQERQVKDADRFRRESLLSMCFETWKLGSDWIHSTHTQIIQARNHIQLRIYFNRWREKNARFRVVCDRATQVARFRKQSASFNVWREKTRLQKVARWREEMRKCISMIKRIRDERIQNDSWTKWHQSYRSRKLYARNVFTRIFRRWRERLQRLRNLESLADSLEEAREHRTLETIMEMWSRRIQLHDAEVYLTHTITRKKLALSFETWFRITQENRYADAHHALHLLKGAFSIWREAKAKMLTLDNRGDKYLRRRDNLLLRAVVRVWVSRERGQLLQRVRCTRLMKDAFVVWQQHHQQQTRLQDSALAFEKQSSNILLSSTLRTWAQHCDARKNALSLGERRYKNTLLYRTFWVWRSQLWTRLRMVRRAKMARKYFLERLSWDRWRLAVAENKRKKTLQQLEGRRLNRAFSRWLHVTRRKRYQEGATNEIQRLLRKRVLRNALQHWTNRVVSLKLREIDTVEQYERDCLASAFLKWKDMRHRHVENLSLVSSFQDVKREDALRRSFFKWLAAARKSKNRRLRLAEREQELRLETLGAAWETWRDRFRENTLRDIEYRVIIQNQAYLLYNAFVIWQSRSKSVPGIRFYATNLKAKVWDRWRAAMPLAVQARKAREMDAKHLLTSAFRRWSEVHRTKLALKAVARARYLRLPSPGQRASSSPPEPPPLRPLLHRPLRSRTPLPVDDKEPVPSSSVPTPAPFMPRRGFSSLLAARPASRAATTDDPSSRPAPPQSSAGDDDRRERLWNELRGMRLREHGRAKSR